MNSALQYSHTPKHRNIILSFHDFKLALRHAANFSTLAIREGDGKAASSCQVA
jgi:hypothetical protein